MPWLPPRQLPLRNHQFPELFRSPVSHTPFSQDLNGLNYEPSNVVAQVGDIVQFQFLPKNHTVTQSNFDKPCEPLTDAATGAITGFNSGFNFAIAEGVNKDVFQIVIEDSKPIWYYCAQTKGNHCQMGMVGAINQNFDSDKTLSVFKESAMKTEATVFNPTVQGGNKVVNPNP